jgi:hypothetical protein
VPAGTYIVQCDAIIIRPVDVDFALVHRRGSEDTVLTEWSQRFEPLPDGVYEAQPYELERTAPAIDFQAGDQFVFRITGYNSTAMQSFIPNGDGALANGRIPRITLPH